MKRMGRWFTGIVAALVLLQSLAIGPAIAAAEEVELQTESAPIQANALFGTTVRGGSHANTPAATGSSTIPRELIEAKWAGDASFSRRGHIELDMPQDVNWNEVTSIKLRMFLKEHSGSGKQDTIQVFKTDKPDISEENWTWNATSYLMDSAEVVGEQLFTNVHTGSWVEIDITSLRDSIMNGDDPNAAFALALYPKASYDQGGIRFYSQHQESGKYKPYLTIYTNEYSDTLPPTLQVNDLADGMDVTNETLSFQLQVSDNDDPNPIIHLAVNGQSQTAASGSNTVTLKSGNNVIELSAEDASGNKSETQIYHVVYTRSIVLPVVADTYTDIRSPGTNYNNSTEKGGLQLKTPATGTSTRKVYLSYDLTGNQLQYVKKAEIQLYLFELMGTDRTNEIVTIHEIPSFDESTLTWSNAPASGAKVGDVSYSRSSANTYAGLDITSYINNKLASSPTAERLNFVLEIVNGHDQKGIHIVSKEKNPSQMSRLLLVEGLPAPSLEVEGIEDNSLHMTDNIPNVIVTAESVSSSVSVEVAVTVNGNAVASKGDNKYDIPLSLGVNSIVITATDQEGNKKEERYTVTRLNALEAGVYYVDSAEGNDQNDGRSEAAPWKSLEHLNSLNFMPGSTILFKRGSIWNGQFRPNGSGTEEHPIIVDAYGEGSSKPIINGNGISNLDTGNVVAEGAVHLYNLSYWELNNLEVTNEGAVVPNASRAGIMVVAGGLGFVNHVHVKNVYVHNVNSHDDAQKISGGIIFRGDTMDEKGNITNISSGFNDILVENSHIKDVAIEGLRTKTYKNGADTGQIKNTDVVFRNNLIENILGDGIVISEMASGGLVEKNIIRRHSMSTKSRNYAGLWFYQTNGVIAQYNEVYDGVHGYNDGEAFDFDIGATNNIYQYNYSHNNRGGFLLTMTSAGVGNVFRYNVSKNDGRGTEIFFCMNDRTEIYNNTIYVGEGVVVPYLINETNIQNMFFKNNIIHVDGEIQKYSKLTQSYSAPRVSNNLFYPASVASLSGSPNAYDTLVTADPLLADPSADSIVMDTWTQHIWDANVAHFKIGAGSPAIDAGAAIANPGAQDLYGTPLYEGNAPDIGAHEYVASVSVESVELTEGSVSLLVGGTHQAIATVLPNHATNKAVVWSSTHAEIAEVDETGLITAKAPGTANVTATTADGGKTALLTVTVTSPTPTPTPTPTSSPSPNPNPSPESSATPKPTPSPTPSPPVVETDLENGSVTSVVHVKAETDSGGTPAVVIDKQQADTAVEAAMKIAKDQGNNLSPAVEFRLSSPVSSGTIETTLTQSALAALVNGEVSSLKVTTPLVSIQFDDQALASIQSQANKELKIAIAKGNSISSEAQGLIGNRPVYDISLSSGNAAISKFEGAAIVTVPYQLQLGEDPNALLIYYVNANGQPEVVTQSVYDAASGTVKFRTGHFSRYAVGYNQVSFIDVAEDAWYSGAVSFAAARGIVLGTGKDRFSPDAKLTRAQFMVLAMRAYGIAPDDEPHDNFADAGEAYYTGYLAAAKRLNLSKGVGGNRFAPDSVITREEQLTLLYEVLRLKDELPRKQKGKELAGFSDANEISEWATEAITFFVRAGIVQGSDNALDPAGAATRAQMVQLLNNLLAP